MHVKYIDHEWKGFSVESIKAILARPGFVIIRDLYGFGYVGRLVSKMLYFFNIDYSKKRLTDVTPKFNKMPIFFLLFYPLIYFFVLIDAAMKIKNDNTGHCLFSTKILLV